MACSSPSFPLFSPWDARPSISLKPLSSFPHPPTPSLLARPLPLCFSTPVPSAPFVSPTMPKRRTPAEEEEAVRVSNAIDEELRVSRAPLAYSARSDPDHPQREREVLRRRRAKDVKGMSRPSPCPTPAPRTPRTLRVGVQPCRESPKRSSQRLRSFSTALSSVAYTAYTISAPRRCGTVFWHAAPSPSSRWVALLLPSTRVLSKSLVN